MKQVFVVHHNPNAGRYAYRADPDDAIASAEALVAGGEGNWVAGNCRRMMREGDLLLFKFGGARLKQEPGIYAAAHVSREPSQNELGKWFFQYKPDAELTRRLLRSPITGTILATISPRSFGASIQVVRGKGPTALADVLGDRVVTTRKVAARERITRGLIIREEPLEKIFAGTKTCEVRGTGIKLRGIIALIQSKSGHVVGTCEIIGVEGPFTLTELRRRASTTGFRPDALPYPKTYCWMLRGAQRLPKPVPYQHPPGAVIWVELKDSVIRQLRKSAAQR